MAQSGDPVPRIDLSYVDDLGGALGTSAGGRIQILNGLSPAVEFTTLVHEFAHELLHRNVHRPASRNMRELEAEAVAFVVSTGTGIDTSASSRDDIQLYGGDRESLTQALDRIQRAASLVLRALTAPGGNERVIREGGARWHHACSITGQTVHRYVATLAHESAFRSFVLGGILGYVPPH